MGSKKTTKFELLSLMRRLQSVCAHAAGRTACDACAGFPIHCTQAKNLLDLAGSESHSLCAHAQAASQLNGVGPSQHISQHAVIVGL